MLVAQISLSNSYGNLHCLSGSDSVPATRTAAQVLYLGVAGQESLLLVAYQSTMLTGKSCYSTLIN